MKRFLIYIIFSFLAISCTTTKYVEVPIETIKTEYINKILHDSVFVRDSIDRFIKGDTVFLTNYKYIYKQKLSTDTIYKTDSILIPIIQTVEKIEYQNKLNLFQELFIFLGIVFVLYIAVNFTYHYVKDR